MYSAANYLSQIIKKQLKKWNYTLLRVYQSKSRRYVVIRAVPIILLSAGANFAHLCSGLPYTERNSTAKSNTMTFSFPDGGQLPGFETRLGRERLGVRGVRGGDSPDRMSANRSIIIFIY